jgi:phosphoglycolate phosphatase
LRCLVVASPPCKAIRPHPLGIPRQSVERRSGPARLVASPMKNWTLVFDLDGTLVDTAPDLAAATNHVLKTVSLEPVDQANIRPFVGHGALAMIKGAAEARGRSFSERELYDLFEVFLAYYTAHIADESRPFDHTLATLDALKADGATLAVCTNKMESPARQLLEALGMNHYFAAITGRDSLGVWKPDRGHILGTVRLASGDAARTIMIGDSETDIMRRTRVCRWWR